MYLIMNGFKKIMLPTLLFFIFFQNYATAQTFLNLDFEIKDSKSKKLKHWYLAGKNYETVLDDVEKFTQTTSLKIQHNKEAYKQGSFGVCTNDFPIDLVRGKTIEFIGRIKTKDVANGYAGLWWRVDGKDVTLGFDNMSTRGLTGDNDWQEVSIKMRVSYKAININFGGLLVGTGTAWFDNFEIFIEGKKFTDLPPRTTLPTPQEIAWLKKHIYPLHSCAADSKNNRDLKVLHKLLGKAKIVALGDVTYGSSEILQMKHRLLKFLAEEKGFDLLSMEANMPESAQLNQHILQQEGPPISLLQDMNSWIWENNEFLEVVKWMQEHNTHSSIQLAGFDVKDYKGAIKELQRGLKNEEKTLELVAQLSSQLDNFSQNLKEKKRYHFLPEEKLSIESICADIKNQMAALSIPATEQEWLDQNLRLIQQYMDKYYRSRNQHMAENLTWSQQQNPNSKIVVWAHNNLIKKSKSSITRYLPENLKKDYLSIGFAFYDGQYTSKKDEHFATHDAQTPMIDSYEFFFNAADEPFFLLDLRKIKKNTKNAWLTQQLNFRTTKPDPRNHGFRPTQLTEDFDLIIFINKSSSSTLLDQEQ